ncbi:unnamed protein product, partial [Nesidiocoris tenuis]
NGYGNQCVLAKTFNPQDDEHFANKDYKADDESNSKYQVGQCQWFQAKRIRLLGPRTFGLVRSKQTKKSRDDTVLS